MAKKKYEWDLFISHASEDKETFVRALSKQLQSFGVHVWYDEFSLKLGDSLSRSIDKGLSSSQYGLVILSKNFITKPWTEYELRGLTAREMQEGKRILPLWHKITKKDVLKFSPSLADKLALKTEGMSIRDMALEIISVVRPDIIKAVHKYIAYQKILSETTTEKIPIKDLIKNFELTPKRHKNLPEQLVRRYELFVPL